MALKLHYHIVPFHDLKLEELYALIKLRVDVFVVEQECPYPELDNHDQKCYHLMGRDAHGELKAAARIVPAGVIYPKVSIGRVVVRDDARNDGIGEELMRMAMNFCEKQLAANTIKIAAQAYLERFYNRLGFRTISDPYLWDGIDHIDMLWELNASG